MKRSLNLTGIEGKSYDLEELKKSNVRTGKDSLVIEVWYWHPDAEGDHRFPNPPNPEIGRIWFSKQVATLEELAQKIGG